MTHARAKQIIAGYSEEKIQEMAKRGSDDPQALTTDEARVVLAWVWLREMRKRG